MAMTSAAASAPVSGAASACARSASPRASVPGAANVGEAAVDRRRDVGFRPERERLFQRLPLMLRVVVEEVHLGGLAEELNLRLSVLGQRERALEERERLAHLVATRRKLGGAAQPRDPLALEPRKLIAGAGPGEVGVLAPDGLGVVVGKERGVLVAPFADPL